MTQAIFGTNTVARSSMEGPILPQILATPDAPTVITPGMRAAAGGPNERETQKLLVLAAKESLDVMRNTQAKDKAGLDLNTLPLPPNHANLRGKQLIDSAIDAAAASRV